MSGVAPMLPNKLLVVEVGSTLHGIGIGSDDTDYMGVCLEPPETVFGLGTFEQYQHRTAPEGVRSGPGDVDVVIYGLKKWMRLAAKGNPSVIMPLYAPPEFIDFMHPLGEELRGLHSAIVSRKCKGRFLGYLNGQRDRAERDRGSGRGRREGREAKWASHMVRLGYQAEELLSTGWLTLPMPPEKAEVCRAIKRGEVSFREALDLSTEQVHRIERLDGTALLPKPDMGRIESWMQSAYMRVYAGAGPLAETDATGKGAELRDVPAPTHLPEIQVVAAAWPIYDRLIQDEDPAALRRLSSVWAEARQIAERSLRAAREAA